MPDRQHSRIIFPVSTPLDVIDKIGPDELGIPAREADPYDILRQIGTGTYLAVNGGRPAAAIEHTYVEEHGVGIETCGARFATGRGARLQIVVILHASDTYVVARCRLIARGRDLGRWAVEYRAEDVYAEDLAEIVYQASLTH